MKYSIKRVVVRNLYSEVMIGQCCNDHQSHEVIIKTVLPPIFGNILKRLTAAKMLEHSGIPKMVDFGEYCEKGNKKYYATTEYIPGITLTYLLKKLAVLKAKIPTSVVFHIFSCICDILEYTHRFQIEKCAFLPHGNLCPDQVLISFDGTVYLTDTGIADLVTYRYDGVGLVKNEFSIFNHTDIHHGKACRKRHELYSLGILLLCMLTGNDDFLLCMDKLSRGKGDSLSSAFSSVEAGVSRVIASLIGEKFPGVPGTFNSIEEVIECINIYKQVNGFKNSKEQTMILIYALFNDSFDIPCSIPGKISDMITNKQYFDKDLLALLHKTSSWIQETGDFSAIVQDYKVETESIPVVTVAQSLNETCSESQEIPEKNTKNLLEQQLYSKNSFPIDTFLIEEPLSTEVNIKKANTSVFEAFAGIRVDTSAFYRKEKQHPFANLIVKR
ncbi:MAG TPA: protein kinase [Chitinispirillaceae bacterium]|nr:protein kinase [Chitinispirillaceae bacterium]